jgi:hypothetical protein
MEKVIKARIKRRRATHVRAKQTWTRAEMYRAVYALRAAQEHLACYLKGQGCPSYSKAEVRDALLFVSRVEDTFAAGKETLPQYKAVTYEG